MTHEKKDKKNKNCSSLKDEFIFEKILKIMMQLPIFRNLRKNAIRLLESIESLKEGKVEVISLFELPQK